MTTLLERLDRAIFSVTRSRENSAIPLTANAKRYGEAHSAWIVDGSSGLTPIGSPDIRSAEDYGFFKTINDYQKKNSVGTHYTSQDFTDLLVAEKPDAKPSSLPTDNDAIMPLFKNWAAHPKYAQGLPVGWGTKGSGVYWDGTHAEVQEILRPSFSLASRILISDPSASSYFDALFHGERRAMCRMLTQSCPSDHERLPWDFKEDLEHNYDGSTLESVWPREPEERDAQSTLDTWNSFTPQVRFNFEPWTVHQDTVAWSGFTRWDKTTRLNTITIAPSSVTALFSSQITTSERLRKSFDFAHLLIHELAHAVGNYNDAQRYPEEGEAPHFWEPYFQDEPVAELGYSCANAIFGHLPNCTGPKKNRDFEGQNIERTLPMFWHGASSFPIKSRCHTYSRRQPALDTEYESDKYPSLVCKFMGTDFLERIHEIGYWDVLVAKFGNDVLRDFDPRKLPLRDFEAPFELYSGVGQRRTTRIVERLKEDLSGESIHDVTRQYRAARLRTARSVVMKVNRRRRQLLRDWTRFRGPNERPPWTFDSIPDSVLDALYPDEVIQAIADEMRCAPLALRNRGRIFVQNAIQDFLEREAWPRKRINFADRDVLLTQEENSQGVVATDLDDIYLDILQCVRDRGDDPFQTIIEPLQVSQQGGDPWGMHNLKALVREWLRSKKHDPARLDEEMNRRHTDPTQPIRTFYIEPILQEVVEIARKKTEEDVAAGIDWSWLPDFAKAEAVRDVLEIHQGYPRDVLDHELGALPRDPGNSVWLLKQRFLDDCLVRLGWEVDDIRRDALVEDRAGRDWLLDNLRIWLLSNNYSTALTLGLYDRQAYVASLRSKAMQHSVS